MAMTGLSAAALRVLVCQRGEDFVEALAELLRQEGFVTQEAPDATTALDLLGHGQGDLALLDIARVGPELVPLLRQACALARPVPVLLLPADQAAWQRARLLRAILDAVGEALLVMSADERLLYSNPAAGHLLGVKAGELTADAVLRQQDLRRADGVTPLPHAERPLARALRGEAVDEAEVYFRRPRAPGLWLRATARPLVGLGGAVVLYRDITEEKLALRSQRQDAEGYQAVAEACGQGLCVLQDGQVQWANPACARLLGYADLRDLLGCPWEELAAGEGRSVLRAQVAAALDGAGGAPRTWQAVRPDGGRVWMETTAASLRWQQRPAVLLTLGDVSERQGRDERWLAAHKRQALGALAGGVAHDFNNLLSVMTGYVEVVQHGLDSEDPARTLLTEVLRAAERAAALTRQLLSFNRAAAPVPRELDLNALVRGAAAVLARVLGDGIRLRVELGAAPARVRADPDHLEHVIFSLAVAARDDLPPGGELVLRTATISAGGPVGVAPSEVPPGRYVLLEVTAPMRLAAAAADDGPGLGMAAVAAVVRRNGGHVWSEATPGRPLTVRVYLPACAAAERGPLPRGGARS
jgi:two-component system NtrC family sensor kinase